MPKKLALLSAGGKKYLCGPAVSSKYCDNGVDVIGIFAKAELTTPFVPFVFIVKLLKLNGDVSSIQFILSISKYI